MSATALLVVKVVGTCPLLLVVPLVGSRVTLSWLAWLTCKVKVTLTVRPLPLGTGLLLASLTVAVIVALSVSLNVNFVALNSTMAGGPGWTATSLVCGSGSSPRVVVTLAVTVTLPPAGTWVGAVSVVVN